MNALRSLLLLAVPLAFVLSGRALVRATPRPGRGTLALLALVGLPFLLQLLFPELLDAFRRDPQQIMWHGEYWRLLTAILFQDGWLAGLAFNLVILLLIAPLAETVWGSLPTVLLFFLGGSLVNGLLVPMGVVGAGNSLANLVLGGSLGAVALLRGRGRREAVVGLGLGAGLGLLGDYHWVALVVGTLAGALLWSVWRERGRGPTTV